MILDNAFWLEFAYFLTTSDCGKVPQSLRPSSQYFSPAYQQLITLFCKQATSLVLVVIDRNTLEGELILRCVRDQSNTSQREISLSSSHPSI
jgi:hypothetical protein